MRFITILPTLPLLFAMSTFAIAETVDGTVTSTDNAAHTACATGTAECVQSGLASTITTTTTANAMSTTSAGTPKSTASLSGSGNQETDSDTGEIDGDGDLESDSDSGIKEGHPTTSYSGLKANMQMTGGGGSVARYRIGEGALGWWCMAVGLGVFL